MSPCSFTSIPRGPRLTKSELCLFSNLFMSVISVTVDKAFIGTGYCGSAGKQSACNAGDLGSIPGLGRSPGEGKGYPSQVTKPRGTALLCCAQQKGSRALSCLNWSTATPVLREGPGVLGQRAGSRRGTRKASPWGTGLQQQGLIQVTRGERQRAPS